MAHECGKKRCTIHGYKLPVIRGAFKFNIDLQYSAGEKRALAELTEAAMLPDELGLSVLDDEAPEVIERAALVSRYYIPAKGTP